MVHHIHALDAQRLNLIEQTLSDQLNTSGGRGILVSTRLNRQLQFIHHVQENQRDVRLFNLQQPLPLAGQPLLEVLAIAVQRLETARQLVNPFPGRFQLALELKHLFAVSRAGGG